MKNRILCHSPWTMVLFSSILLSGCGIPAKPSQTIMTITNPKISNDLLLPAELLYIFQGQIWQLSTDGRNTIQITNEIDPVTSFDASPTTDHLVYVSGNLLIYIRGDGSQRKILRQGKKNKCSYWSGSVLWLDLVQKKIFSLPITNISQLKWGVDEVK